MYLIPYLIKIVMLLGKQGLAFREHRDDKIVWTEEVDQEDTQGRTCQAVHAKKLKDTCKTRWIQHIDYYAIFPELLPAMHVTLQAMVSPAKFDELGTDWNWDGETMIKANA